VVLGIFCLSAPAGQDLVLGRLEQVGDVK